MLILNINLSALPRITKYSELEEPHKDRGVQLLSEWPMWGLKTLWGAGTETLHCLHVAPAFPGLNTSENGAFKAQNFLCVIVAPCTAFTGVYLNRMTGGEDV